MRSQNLKSYGCQTFVALVASVAFGAALLTLSGCGRTAATENLKIVTPYGVYDGTTSGTTVIDTRPLFDYVVRKQLEK